MLTPDAFRLDGKVALVTGGARGLGRAISAGLASFGADVALASRDGARCEVEAEIIAKETGVQARGYACHVGHWDECTHLVDQVYDDFGHIDILVSNAGMSPLYTSLDLVEETYWDKVLGVNLKGPFRLAALTGTRMAQDRGGSIIAVSSIAAVRPVPGELPYSAAKAGLNAMIIGMSRGFGPTVRANVVMPGPFLTDVTNAWDMEQFDAFAQREIPLRRAGQPDEIVGAVVYLAADASSYTTGAVIKVDGGVAFRPG